jgi:site-specific recombinase XerD
MLTLWKRHSPSCKKEHEKEFKSLEPEKHRFFKKCQCACWVTGVHPITNQYLKRSLNTTSWEAGENLKVALESEAPSIVAARERAKSLTLAAALTSWIADKQYRGVSESTCSTMYRTFEACLLNFAKDYGITLLTQLDVKAVFALTESSHWRKWKLSTANRQLTNLRAFLKFALVREWIEKNPALGVQRAVDDSEMVDPYEPDELDRLEVAFATWTEKLETRTGQWATHPATLLCLKHVLEDTGLRISDALRARPAVIEVQPNGDGVWTLDQNKKDGKWTRKHAEVTVYLRRSTLEEMKRVSWCSEKYPFMTQPRKPETDRAAFKKHLHEEGIRVYTAMQKVGEVAGVENCRPHRFRHTFAVKMLMDGWELEKVARFLGHRDTHTLQRHYSKWTDRRQEQLRNERLRQFENERSVQQIPQSQKVG